MYRRVSYYSVVFPSLRWRLNLNIMNKNEVATFPFYMFIFSPLPYYAKTAQEAERSQNTKYCLVARSTLARVARVSHAATRRYVRSMQASQISAPQRQAR